MWLSTYVMRKEASYFLTCCIVTSTVMVTAENHAWWSAVQYSKQRLVSVSSRCSLKLSCAQEKQSLITCILCYWRCFASRVLPGFKSKYCLWQNLNSAYLVVQDRLATTEEPLILQQPLLLAFRNSLRGQFLKRLKWHHTTLLSQQLQSHVLRTTSYQPLSLTGSGVRLSFVQTQYGHGYYFIETSLQNCLFSMASRHSKQLITPTWESKKVQFK